MTSKLYFSLGTMSPKEASQQLIVDLTNQIVRLRNQARSAAMNAKTIKEGRFYEGKVSMADTLSVFLARIEIVE